MLGRTLIALGCAMALGACSTMNGGGGEPAASASTPAADAETPFPSTYERYPGRPTALVGATVFDGAGNRFDNATVLFRDGKVVAVHVAPGDRVEKGQTLAVLEAMKMEFQLQLPVSGVVEAVSVASGTQVRNKQLLLSVTPDA